MLYVTTTVAPINATMLHPYSILIFQARACAQSLIQRGQYKYIYVCIPLYVCMPSVVGAYAITQVDALRYPLLTIAS